MISSYYHILIEAFVNTNSYGAWVKHLSKYSITKEVVDAIKNVPQSTYYHPEFSVLKHTYYVCKAVYMEGNLACVKYLEAAFLHDVGKSVYTMIGKNRIWHYKHPQGSYDFAKRRSDYIMDSERTLELILYHMNVGMKFDIEEHLISGSDIARFAYWDKVRSKQLYFEESNFISRWFNKVREQMLFLKQELSTKKIVFLVGVSGSGKTTYIKKHHLEKYVVSPDNLRKIITGDISNQDQNAYVFSCAFHLLKDNINRFGFAIFDATNIHDFYRIMSLRHFNGIRKEAWVFPVSEAKILRERIEKDLEFNDRANVPLEVLTRQIKNFNRGFDSLYNEFNSVKYVG